MDLSVIIFSFICVGEKQIQTLKEQSRRYYMEEMMVKLKLEQMKKMTDNECEKVYSLAQQKEELILVGIFCNSIHSCFIAISI